METKMKIKRIVRLTAIILALAMMPLWIFGCGRLDAKVIDRFAELIEGTGKIDTKSDSGKLYIAEIDAMASDANGTITSAGTWQVSSVKNEDSLEIAHYRKTYALAKAWATKGSAYYHKSEILKNIKAALEYGYTIYFGTPVSHRLHPEWSSVEKVTIGEFLLNTLIILDANNKLSGKKIEKYAEILEIKFPLTFEDAVIQNRALYIMIGTAALMGNTDKIKGFAEKYLFSSFNYVTSGRGLYADGSYIADNNVASSGSHGIIAFNTLTTLLYAVNGTKADVPDDVKAVDFLYSWAVNSVIPSIYNGSSIAATTGSYIAQSDEMGALGVSSLLVLTELLDSERAGELKSIVKAYASSENTSFVPYLTGYGIRAFQDVENNNKLVSKSVSGAHPFAAMDKLVVAAPRYSASLSISSIRSAKYETREMQLDVNKELHGAVNGSGWFEGDGMLLLSNPYYQISNVYWQHVNYGRLPGTTVDSRTRTPSNPGVFTGISSYAGFAVHGDFSVAANLMYNNNSEYLSDLTAKKSWFIFDDEIVCLGAGISNTSLVPPKANAQRPQTIETVVENIFYGDNNSIILSANDLDNDLVPSSSLSVLTNSSLYFSRYGGIYVPANKNDVLNARRNQTSAGNFIELWIDHGVTPKNATYEYAILPGSTISEFFDYTEAVGYNVISNNEALQAVSDVSSGASGFTFWKATTVAENNSAYSGVIKGADFACTVLVKEDATSVTVSIADFTHLAADNKLGGSITIDAARAVVSADAGLALNGNTITVDRAVAASGQTLTIVLSK